jgi:plastocyanin
MSPRPQSNRRIFIIMAILALPFLAVIAFTGIIRTRAAHPGKDVQADSPQTASISMVDFEFQPKVITITTGTSVRWTNNGTVPHTTTSDTGIWDSGDVTLGGSYTVTFETPGVFPYHCFHHAPAMVGTVVVIADTFLPFIAK